MRARVTKGLEWLLSYFPSRLPQTDKQLDAFIRSILALGGFPDNDSLRQALASQIMNLGHLTSFKSRLKFRKRHFIRGIEQAILNQTAYNLIADIRERAKAAKDGSNERLLENS